MKFIKQLEQPTSNNTTLVLSKIDNTDEYMIAQAANLDGQNIYLKGGLKIKDLNTLKKLLENYEKF